MSKTSNLSLEKQENAVGVVKIRQHVNYGSIVYYPANPDADIFARIAGTKTMGDRLLRDIKALGYIVETVSNEKWS